MSRKDDVDEIRQAYIDAEKALAKVGNLLRTTEAGKYLWANRHKMSVSGLKAVVILLRNDVPDYKD